MGKAARPERRFGRGQRGDQMAPPDIGGIVRGGGASPHRPKGQRKCRSSPGAVYERAGTLRRITRPPFRLLHHGTLALFMHFSPVAFSSAARACSQAFFVVPSGVQANPDATRKQKTGLAKAASAATAAITNTSATTTSRRFTHYLLIYRRYSSRSDPCDNPTTVPSTGGEPRRRRIGRTRSSSTCASFSLGV